MLDEIIGYHRWAVYGLLAVMGYNLLIPMLMRSQILKMIFWTRVGYFAFWAFWTMVVFGGIITWIFKLRELSLPVLAMMVVSAVLLGIESMRPFKLKALWLSGEDGIKANTLMVGSEWLMTLAVTVYALMVR